MARKFLSYAGLQAVVQKILALIPSKTSDLINDAGFITSVPEEPSKAVVNVLTYATTAPSEPEDGDMYIDSANNVLYEYDETNDEWSSVDASQDSVYVTADTSHLYLYNGTAFVDASGEEVDNTIYIRNRSDLDDITTEGVYEVLQSYPGMSAVRMTLTVARIVLRKKVTTTVRLEQTLTSHTGYSKRTKVNDGDWSEWEDFTYASEEWVGDVISSKADKVASATSGNFAGLDSHGNLTDSGSKASDFATAAQGALAATALQNIVAGENVEVNGNKVSAKGYSLKRDAFCELESDIEWYSIEDISQMYGVSLGAYLSVDTAYHCSYTNENAEELGYFNYFLNSFISQYGNGISFLYIKIESGIVVATTPYGVNTSDCLIRVFLRENDNIMFSNEKIVALGYSGSHIATGRSSHAENHAIAEGNFSHAEGNNTLASGINSHSEGYGRSEYTRLLTSKGCDYGKVTSYDFIVTRNNVQNSYRYDVSSGTTGSVYEDISIGEVYMYISETDAGFVSIYGKPNDGELSLTRYIGSTAKLIKAVGIGAAIGESSHSEGLLTLAIDTASHAEGEGTIAVGRSSHVEGTYNAVDLESKYLHIVGNGTGENNRSNAFAITRTGNLVLFNNGTAVELTPAKLAQLVNSTFSESGHTHSQYANKVEEVQVAASVSSQELAPNTLYNFAERTGNLTLTLGTAISGIANEYQCIIAIGSTAPTITWPNGISWYGGNAPTIAANKTYEISILNNIAVFIEV